LSGQRDHGATWHVLRLLRLNRQLLERSRLRRAVSGRDVQQVRRHPGLLLTPRRQPATPLFTLTLEERKLPWACVVAEPPGASRRHRRSRRRTPYPSARGLPSGTNGADFGHDGPATTRIWRGTPRCGSRDTAIMIFEPAQRTESADS